MAEIVNRFCLTSWVENASKANGKSAFDMLYRFSLHFS